MLKVSQVMFSTKNSLLVCLFLVVCRENEYVYPGSSPGLCAPCPANSVSGGGTPSLCTCNTGTGRVNDTDVTLPCLGE